MLYNITKTLAKIKVFAHFAIKSVRGYLYNKPNAVPNTVKFTTFCPNSVVIPTVSLMTLRRLPLRQSTFSGCRLLLRF